MPTIVYHSGDGGQYLLLFPNQGIVVARVRDGEEAVGGESFPQADPTICLRARSHISLITSERTSHSELDGPVQVDE